MAQTTYEEYLANLMGNINPQGGMVTGQMPQATPTTPPPQMAMPDISNIQQALQGVRDVNKGYVAPQLSDLNLVRQQNTEKQAEQAAQNLNLPQGMLTSFSTDTGGDGGAVSDDSAWGKMSDSEKAAWVQANPQAYIIGKTIAAALLPGGMLLANMQDPYLNMSLSEYITAKAADAVDGGKQPPAPVVNRNTYSDYGASMNETYGGAGMDATQASLSATSEYYG